MVKQQLHLQQKHTIKLLNLFKGAEKANTDSCKWSGFIFGAVVKGLVDQRDLYGNISTEKCRAGERSAEQSNFIHR